MIDWLFLLQPTLLILGFAVVCYLLGLVCCQRLFGLTSCGLFEASVMGLGYTILLSHALLVLHLFDWPWLLLGWSLPLVLLRPKWQWHQLLKQASEHAWLWVFLLLFFIPEVWRVFTPEGLHDGISYHLPYAQQFAQEQALLVNPYLRYPLNALNIDLLMALGFLFEGEILARMMHTYCALLLVIGTYVLGATHFNRWVGLVAAWALMDSFMIQNLMIAGYIDLGLSLFILAAIVWLLKPTDAAAQRPALLASGVAMGLALGSKYLALMVLPLYLFWVAFRTERRLWWQVLLVVVVIGSPWYLRNLWVAGNPIHPFAQQWLGFWLWTEADLMAQQQDLLAHHGVPQTWFNLVQLPWLFLQQTFEKHGPLNILIIAGMALAPLGLLYQGVLRQMAVFSLVSLMLWFFSSQIARYLIYVMPLLALISAYFLVKPTQWLLAWTRSKLIPNDQPVRALILGRYAFMVLLVAFAVHKNIRYFDKISEQQLIATSPQSWFDLLSQKPHYLLAKQALESHQKGIFLLTDEAIQHYLRGEGRGDWYGVANMRTFAQSAQQQGLAQTMQQYEVDVLLLEHGFVFAETIMPLIEVSPLTTLAENPFGRVVQLNTQTHDGAEVPNNQNNTHGKD